jgi:DNA mismatch repair protein MSH6
MVSSAPNYVWPQMIARHPKGTAMELEGEGAQGVQGAEVNGPQLDIQAGRHPMLEYTMSQRGEGDYIPNTLVLGGSLNGNAYSPKLLLLSGPNMGGKSTLLRQTCLITILAQMGCKVPADKCVMTPVDRIFTRVGASDRILAGQSTFFVELAETATILRSATEDSLCILDELGRGTATFDGTAIAHAVVDHLARVTRCRSLFATHYHSLVDDWEMDARVQLGHMDCLVQQSEQEQEKGKQIKGDQEEVTFLYRLCSGSSPRSYGINVARLARLPQEVIDLAMRQSREFEERMRGGEEALIAPVSEIGKHAFPFVKLKHSLIM